MKTRTLYQTNSLFTTKCHRVQPLATVALSLFALSGQSAGSLYESVVIGNGPLAYYRFNDPTNRPNINLNSGSLGPAANATNLNTHIVNDNAINGSRDAATYFDSTARTIVPWTAALNPNASNDFTIESWFNPSSDKTFGAYPAPAPIMNSFSGAASNRQGWVYFQRSPNASYPNTNGVGWNFRMYTGVGSNVGVNITSGVPYRLGEWQHVVTVWDGTAQTGTMYINGTQVTSGGNTSSDPSAYVANTDKAGQPDAPKGPAGFSIGAYNNTEPGSNAFMGAVDEVAFYTKKLSPAQILAHYQNATNASRTVGYDALVQSDGAVGYWRLNDLPADTNDVAINQGTLQKLGEAINTRGVRHPVPSPPASSGSSGYGYHFNGGPISPQTGVPAWTAVNNPPPSVAFTLEIWLRPMWDQAGNGQCPISNRWRQHDRTGWVMFQRDPNSSYSGQAGSAGIGWNFRMHSGSGSAVTEINTGVPYNIGDWTHFVVTWQPQTDLGPAANGADSWMGTLTGYIDGVSVITNSNVVYAANTNPSQDGTPASDIAIGAYNDAAGGPFNGFEGEIREVAFYNNYLLTPNQVLAHYQAGTNAHPATNYATLVLTAAYDGAGTQGLQPASYFRLNEPAFYPAANRGSLGDAARGSLVFTTNHVPGPLSTGFEATNSAVTVGETNALPGVTTGWVSLNSPAGLNTFNQLTLEVWILPVASQAADPAYIFTYGPPLPSFYAPDTVTLSGIQLSTNQIFLAITNGGNDYAFSFYDGTNYHGVSYPVGSDLTDGQWVYLAGTYDGSTWHLFRNGQEVTNSTDVVGALTVSPGSEWAIGARGMGWANYFAGSIDEVAIYNVALSPATIKAHYYVAQSGPVSLTITRSGANVSVNWPAGILQSASALAGPWTDMPGATSPYQTSIGSGTIFYRVKL
jgi:hypothetical protein